MGKDKDSKKAGKYKKQAKRRGKINRKLLSVVGLLIIAFILAFLFGYNGGMGDGEDGAKGLLESASNLLEVTNKDDDISEPTTKSIPDTSVPTIIVKEADIIYNNQSLTLEALKSQLESEDISEVVLVDQVAIIKYYTDTEAVLKELGITYTEKKATD